MYQEIILDHYKHPQNAGLRETYDAEVHHVNPTCGDEVTLRVKVADDASSRTSPTSGGLLDQPGVGLGDDRPRHRQAGRRGGRPARGVPRPDAVAGGSSRTRTSGGRDRLRGRREVPGPGQVRAAGLDGLEGRDRTGAARADEKEQTEHDLAAATSPRSTSDGLATRPSEEDVTEAMKDVVDPELGINVVDLGLVYGVHLDEDSNVVIDMTLTSAACPLTDVIEDQTNQALGGLVDDVRINWVWMPPWGPDKITDDGREQLRALGFNVHPVSPPHVLVPPGASCRGSRTSPDPSGPLDRGGWGPARRVRPDGAVRPPPSPSAQEYGGPPPDGHSTRQRRPVRWGSCWSARAGSLSPRDGALSVVSKVGRRPCRAARRPGQGQRFARRRDNQARQAYRRPPSMRTGCS